MSASLTTNKTHKNWVDLNDTLIIMRIASEEENGYPVADALKICSSIYNSGDKEQCANFFYQCEELHIKGSILSKASQYCGDNKLDLVQAILSSNKGLFFSLGLESKEIKPIPKEKSFLARRIHSFSEKFFKDDSDSDNDISKTF